MGAKKYIVILLALIFFSQETPAYAKTRQTPQISAEIAPYIKRAQQLLDSNNYEVALSQLDKTLQNPNLTPYEKSLLFQMKGTSHYELHQTQETIQALEDAISAGGLTDKEKQQRRVNIAQLLMTDGEYLRGAEMLEQWGRAGNKLQSNHINLIMQAYLQSESYELALPWAERWFHGAKPKERKHYGVMNFLYNSLGEAEKQIQIVKAMTERWPTDKSISDDLASIYANNGQARKAFDVARNYYLMGNPQRESDILRLIKYHSYFEMYYEAARILDKEIEAGLVSNTLENKVWLSMLYKDAGYDSFAEVFFAEAIAMGSEIAAEKMRQTLMTPQQIPIVQDFGLSSVYPDFAPPKISRKFKIVVSDRDAQPFVRIPPDMPESAKKSGFCKLRFNVDSFGRTENIIAEFCTENLFKIPAVNSLEKWKYKPKVVDGRQKTRVGVETRIKFSVIDEKGRIIPE